MKKTGYVMYGLFLLLTFRICLQAEAGLLGLLQEWGRSLVYVSAQSEESGGPQEEPLPGVSHRWEEATLWISAVKAYFRTVFTSPRGDYYYLIKYLVLLLALVVGRRWA